MEALFISLFIHHHLLYFRGSADFHAMRVEVCVDGSISFTREEKKKNTLVTTSLACFPALALFSRSKGVRDCFGWEPAQLGQTGYPAVLFSINLLVNTLPLIHT